ncbi:hypothetical protein EFK50_19290 [Nocardioides marmoriginsengisoli]|uniref:ASCH domain-containing protein n=1 Tax=Nocardioides marmoriginsengisoli TaxID=661483 RepID=A0A3N0CAJ0_9ACTN|nr:hypothetical protein [Nocardioides marmoriginsengisoli]RNL60470.1 hypothetical protein EFK50_19290 [Nocardioides marmoriginsengisoli]
MLLPPQVAHGVADGSMSVAFRRWKKQAVKPGSEFKTIAGVIRVVSVRAVRPEKITKADAVRAGHVDPDSVRKRLAGDEDWTTYRIELEYAGADPRIALRESAELTDEDVAAIDAKLDRLDRASSHGAWTMRTLDLIRQHPQRRAPDLAEIEGRETAPFKIDVRKLKGMGLTISHPVGYELSPRGLAYLERTRR